MSDKITNDHKKSNKRERGQSIVILAAGIIVLLGFVGLAVDLGYVWARDAKLAAAVDAAVLAGAPELSLGGLPRADEKAIQFLYTNELPADTAVANFESFETQNILGAWEYTITVTWQLQTFFMRIFGFETVNLTKRATAAYFPLVDVYASTRAEVGTVSTSNQSVFGPNGCTGHGDPFSPFNSPYRANPGQPYAYRYRIYIPADYEARAGTSLVRVEILDPDSMNTNAATSSSTVTAPHTQRWINSGIGRPATATLACPSSGSQNNQKNTCVVATGELQNNCTAAQQADPNIFCAEDIDLINPYWFVRIDENRGAGTPPGNNSCGEPTNYNTGFNTQTDYQLYYFQRRPDSTLVRTDLALYTGQTGDGRDFDAGSHNTDLRWVSPGGFNDFGVVPTECNSQTGGYLTPANPTRCSILPGHDDTKAMAGPGNGFEIDLAQDMSNVVVDAGSGARYIYLDISTISGASENGFEVWAGPPAESAGIPSDANLRNLWVADNPNQRSSFGASVFAMGTLPMNASATGAIDIPLLNVPAQYAGREIAVSLFDTDSGTQPPLTFYFDTISQNDYKVVYGTTNPDPEGRCFTTTTDCNNKWVGPPGTLSPAYIIPVPTYTADCVNVATTPEICTPFYGGRLMANYTAGRGDTYVWRITLPSLPYLTE